MKILTVLFFAVVSQSVLSEPYLLLQQCLKNEVSLSPDKNSHSLFDPKMVDQIESYLKMENVHKMFEEKDLAVLPINSEHGDGGLKSYIYSNGGDVASFVISEEEKLAKTNCIYAKSNKLKFLDWLYVGQKAEIVIGKLSVGHEVDAVYIERGETIVEIYFENGVVNLLRFRAYFD